MISDKSAALFEAKLEDLAQTFLKETDVSTWPSLDSSAGRQECYNVQRGAVQTLDAMLRIAALLADSNDAGLPPGLRINRARRPGSADDGAAP